MNIIDEKLNKIKNMDTEPSIFKVFVMACDHMEGIDAWVDFRNGLAEYPSSITCHADTALLALVKLETVLEEKFVVKKGQ